MSSSVESKRLAQAVLPGVDRVLNQDTLARVSWDTDQPVLIVLAAGKGTRFGSEPKCIQPVAGVPLARHSIDSFRGFSTAPSICLVGHEAETVSNAIGGDAIHVLSQNPLGGTAYAAYEAFSVPQLETHNPIVVVTMGDRIIPSAVFDRLLRRHRRDTEADLTMLTAVYQPPKNVGKGRIVRDQNGTILKIIEQRDIEQLEDDEEREELLSQQEGNCPLYAIRARKLKHYLGRLRDHNSQQQFYFTDIVEAIRADGGDARSVTIDSDDPAYRIVCADVTWQADLQHLEKIVAQDGREDEDFEQEHDTVLNAVRIISSGRPRGQVLAIANQLEELVSQSDSGGDFLPDHSVAIGISGGRLRIAFMHPDMGRFFGPAWQIPIGAAEPSGREQIVILMQSADDRHIRLLPTNPEFREQRDAIACDHDWMFPGPEICDVHLYESFGTTMAEQILARLGYFSDQQIAELQEKGEPLPPGDRWISNSMRRPFSLLCNALASIRTVRSGPIAAKVQVALGPDRFRGLTVASTGDIPRGGFSSSSAVTVAAQNAINALFQLGLQPDQLVNLACQSEYGTGVRAGALDQATEQKGSAQQGALISSNPRDNYRIIRKYPVPAERFRVLFPYSVDRDREAWRWSAGMYAQTADQRRLTSSETRKMTGKASEIAAILLRLPLDRDFFQEIQDDLVETGELSTSTALHVRDQLSRIPLHITQQELRGQLAIHAEWYAQQLIESRKLTPDGARELTETTFASLLQGWRDPLMSRFVSGRIIDEVGAPLRAMVGYLYGEVAKNCFLVHHPDRRIECVSASQRGDRCVDINPLALPDKQSMMGEMSWEKTVAGSELMERWLERFDATPFDFNAGLNRRSLSREHWSPRHVVGTNFFRGLPLIDLAEAMLQRAFGMETVALRVNGAGQGDYFQVHVDTELVDHDEVKDFIRQAFYRRFSLTPVSDFVEPHPGGPAVGAKLRCYKQIPRLIAALRRASADS